MLAATDVVDVVKRFFVPAVDAGDELDFFFGGDSVLDEEFHLLFEGHGVAPVT